jgi:hypothetical protein
MSNFVPGRTYYTRSICDHDCIITLRVVERTAHTVKTIDKHGKAQTLRVRRDSSGVEMVKPWGRYSMAPMVGADRELAVVS